ncbi:hypothetical protein [Streptomyces chilikensis]|uniref:Head-to-tail adaptor n=1 Tax=Streptomyces chilikensis TaxID=1194079 RepID=A0ABV3EJF9_9ACTN
MRRDVCEPWPIRPCCDIPEDMSEEDVAFWQMAASQLLFRLSGRRWGPSCPITIRPCGKSCIDGLITSGSWSAPHMVPYIDTGGAWRNWMGCGCKSSCSCTQLCELRLIGPVHDVVEVLVDGEVLAPEAYRVDAPNVLVRVDGGCWDACQDLQAPPTEVGTAAVTYRVGLPLDEAAIAAVSALFCHLLTTCGSSCGCGVNRQGVTKLSRQGVTLDMDPAALLEGPLTGIGDVDRWIMSVNPYGLAAPARVASPDQRLPRRVQWP